MMEEGIFHYGDDIARLKENVLCVSFMKIVIYGHFNRKMLQKTHRAYSFTFKFELLKS